MANEVASGLHNAVPYHWEYTDAAARTGATGFTSADVGKWAHQIDDHSVWMLTATTPTWVHIGGALFSNTVTGGGPAIAGFGDTGYGGDFEASGAGGWGIYGYAGGAGGKGIVAESGEATVIPIEGLAPAGQTADLLQLLVNGVVKFAIAPSGRPRLVSTPPSSATDTGTAGEIAWDSTYLYVAVGTNTWKRTALSTW